MTIVDVFLKLNKTLGLTSTEDYQQLHIDGKDWENTAKADSPDKVKALYGKIHRGIWVKMLMPIAYYILLSKVNKIMKPSDDDLFE